MSDKKQTYVPLHVHTEKGSLLDGAIRIKDLVGKAKEYDMPAVAVTDHGTMFGVFDLCEEAKKGGIKPIVGCEIYTTKDRFQKGVSAGKADKANKKAKGVEQEEPDAQAGTPDSSGTNHLVLLAKNEEGYRNLSRIVTKANLEGFYRTSRADRNLIAEHSSGLIALTACLKGEVPSALLRDDYETARAIAADYLDIFGPGNFYLEMQDNGIPEQDEVNRKLMALGSQMGIPLVATNDCHYLNSDDFYAHAVLLCIQTGRTINDPKRFKFDTHSLYLKSPLEMYRSFQHVPEALTNTLKIAEMTDFCFRTGEFNLPSFPIEGGKTPDEVIAELAFEGLNMKFGSNPEPVYIDRLSFELKMISKMGFSSYLLIVHDFINWARKRGIPVGPGRGSAAGSLVCYAVGITDIDPIVNKLLFERFLNPDRITMPDIDVDFCGNRRHEVIAYVKEKYGSDHVAQIITFGTMQARAVIRDVGRALEVPYPVVDSIAKLVPDGVKMTLTKALEDSPDLKKQYDSDPRTKELIDLARRLEGLSRHSSTHAAGVVIAPQPIDVFCPLLYVDENNKRGAAAENVEGMASFDMKAIEKLGLLKFDFLGLKTLTVLDYTLRFLREAGVDLDLSKIPLDDCATYEMLSSGDSTAVFQLESDGMRDILTGMKPSRFEDLTALVALYRPGPMAWIADFIKNKKNEAAIVYELPQLKEILEETYGIILYQEQVMMIANKIANFSMGQADLLRRAMGKKKPEEMAKHKGDFIAGAVKNGIPEKLARELFEKVEPFAQYGFNKSHSAAYAYLAYQTAYLKKHYPIEFMAANLSVEMSNADKMLSLFQECRANSLTLLPPDVNKSAKEFTIEKVSLDGTVTRAIRFGLSAVKNLGEVAVERLLSERMSRPYDSLYDFLERMSSSSDKNVKVNKKAVDSMISAGAFDSMVADQPLVARAIFTFQHEEFDKRPKSKKNGNSGAKKQEGQQSLCAEGHGDLFSAAGKSSGGQSSQIGMFGDSIDLFPPSSSGPTDSLAKAGASVLLPASKSGISAIDYNVTVVPWTEDYLLNNEKVALGFYISGHPLLRHRDRLSKAGVIELARLLDDTKYGPFIERAIVQTAGVVSDVTTQSSRFSNNRKYAIMNLEDETGAVNITVNADGYEKYSSFVKKGERIVVKVLLKGDGKVLRRSVLEIHGIDEPILAPNMSNGRKNYAKQQ